MTTDVSQALVPFRSKIPFPFSSKGGDGGGGGRRGGGGRGRGGGVAMDILVQEHSTDAKRGLSICSRVSSRMLL